MSGSSGSRTTVVQRALVAVQVFLLIATLIGPAAVMANEPTPDPTPAPSTEPSPEPTVEPTPEPTAEPTTAPDPTAEPTPDPTAVPDPTLAPTPEPTVAPAPEPTAAPTSAYVVRFDAGVSSADQISAVAEAGAVSTDTVGALRIHAVTASVEAAAALSADVRVTTVELDRNRAVESAPNDAGYAEQWALPMIGWDQAFGAIAPAGTAIVAVLDTGVDASHPDLDANIVSGASFVAGSSWSSDANGHGTAMAGIIAAETGNGSGIAGVGYAGVSVMPITVLGADGLGRDSDIVEGLVWAADHGADVALMAFSANGYSSALQAAVDYAWSKGVVLVAAAGNDGVSTPAFPAGDAGVIGVSATTSDDAVAGFSNTGEAVFMAAPGSGIASIGGSISGTSAAAAHVAGAAALLAADDSSASNGVIVGRLARNADAVGTTAQTGNGRLNLARALGDTETGSIRPAGVLSADGGPFAGPYVAAACTVNSVTIGAQSGALTSGVAGSATFPITLSKSNGNCTGSFTIVGALPAGVTASFSPSTFTGSGTTKTSTLTLATSVSSPAGSHSFTIRAGGGDTGGNVDGIGSFTVAKANQTITFAALGGKTFGDAAFGVSATATSGLAVTFSSTTVPVCTVAGSTVTIVAAGTCTIAADQAGNTNYNAAPQVARSFTVAKASSTTVVTCPVSIVYTGAALTPCTVSVTGAGGLSLTPTAIYTNNLLVGTATASYTYTGDANHFGSGDTKTFTILTAFRIVGFDSPVDMSRIGDTRIYNLVKGGQTVPLKFRVFTLDGTEVTSTTGIGAWARSVSCATGEVDPTLLPVVSTNEAGLKRTGDRFHFNWAVPNGAGKCYQVLIQTVDGSTVMVGTLAGTPVQEAYFKTK